ncbi:MAG: NIPSNAP family protein [Cumulibacter sp.]
MKFELRTYVAAEGKMAALQQRFIDHTIHIFPRHGMHSVGYWVREDDPSVLLYLIWHEGDPKANWNSFKDDPEWTSARAASEVDGSLTASLESVYLDPVEALAIGDLPPKA